MIEEFKGEWGWLSNFAPVPIRVGNDTFPSVEHAFMAMKSTDPEWRQFCLQEPKAGKVKKASRGITLRPGWDEMRVPVMERLLQRKFQQDPFREQLLATGTQVIQEGNWWNDKFWGVCLKTGEGENVLGRLIMKIRNELR